jgi:glycosyltransferase involved in cell wall biosynthesis|tara:strand:+ start:166 stop:1131 length:966 start_codon:yes stop_codon:yes gene_type:complete
MHKITVLMSVYNGDKWIKNSIDSVLSQTENNFEFIIINDGSTDNTSAILKSYNDDRIIIIDQENRGLTKSLNVGLNLAKGKYIARIDADDICMPNRLAEQKKFMEVNTDIALVGSDAILIDENDQYMGHAVYPTSHEMLIKRLKFPLCSVFPHSSIFFRRDVIKKENGYNENFIMSQDLDLYLRLIGKYNISCIDEFLIKLRLNLSGITYSDDNQLVFGLAALISYFRRKNGFADYFNGDDNNWQNFLYEIRKWVTETGLDNKYKAKRDFRVCRNLFKKNEYFSALKVFFKCFYQNPKFLFERGLPIQIPVDIEQFFTDSF